MLARILPVMILIAVTGLPANAQVSRPWNGKKAAVCLTYDDALNVHLDNVVPALDALGLKATFYLSGFFPAFKERSADWRAVAENGHELGNHSLFHPCAGAGTGREWVPPDYNLDTYTMKRLIDEIEMANVLMKAIDGKEKRTFAYPCGDMAVAGETYVTKVRDFFVAERGVTGRVESMQTIDLTNVGAYMIAGESGDQLIALVKEALEKGGLVVFLFHGVGGEHNLNVSLEAHAALLQFLDANEKDVWTAPMVEIAEFVRSAQK